MNSIKVERSLSRSRILKVSMDVLKSQGAASLSMRKIALLLGYSPTAIYAHFESKQAILSEIAKRGFEVLILKVNKAIRDMQPSRLKIEQIWIAYLRFGILEHELYKLMFSLAPLQVDCNLDLMDKSGPVSLTQKALKEIIPFPLEKERILVKTFLIWSLAHGLVIRRIIRSKAPFCDEEKIISEAIAVIIAENPSGKHSKN